MKIISESLYPLTQNINDIQFNNLKNTFRIMETDKKQNEIELNQIESAFTTQYDKDLPDWLKRNSCGIACFYSALKVFGENKNTKFSDFAVDYISGGKFNRPTIGLRTKINGKDVNVPIVLSGEMDDVKKVLKPYNHLLKEYDSFVRVDKQDNEYTQAFTLNGGFDHRGVPLFLKRNNINLESNLVESVNFDDVYSKYKNIKENSKNPLVLLSVNHRDLGLPIRDKYILTSHITTHIILVHGIHKVDNEYFVVYTDPYFINTEDAVQSRSLLTMRNVYAGRATLLYK